jgi:hypothetical protein
VVGFCKAGLPIGVFAVCGIAEAFMVCSMTVDRTRVFPRGGDVEPLDQQRFVPRVER